MEERIVTVETRGLRFFTRRGDAYVRLRDLLSAIEAFRVGAIDTGHDPYLLNELRQAILDSYADAVG